MISAIGSDVAMSHPPAHRTRWRLDPRSGREGAAQVSGALVLAFPGLGGRPGPSAHDVFVLDVLGENLSGVEVLDDLAADHRGEHEDANGRVGPVADLVRTVFAAPKADDVTLLQDALALGRAQRAG